MYIKRIYTWVKYNTLHYTILNHFFTILYVHTMLLQKFLLFLYPADFPLTLILQDWG